MPQSLCQGQPCDETDINEAKHMIMRASIHCRSITRRYPLKYG